MKEISGVKNGINIVFAKMDGSCLAQIQATGPVSEVYLSVAVPLAVLQRLAFSYTTAF